MTPAFRRAAVVCVLAAIAGPAWLLLIYGWRPALATDFTVTPPRQLSGVYPVERDDASGLTFAWTGEVLALRLPGLDRRVPWQLVLRARAARSDPTQNPALSIFADGVELLTTSTTTDFSDVRVMIPARADRHGVTVAVQASATVVPGPHDPRKLGVMLDRLDLAPQGVPRPPRSALNAMALGSFIAALALVVLGGGTRLLVAFVLAQTAATAALAARGFAPFSSYPDSLAFLSGAAWTSAAAVVVIARLATRTSAVRAPGAFLGAFSALMVVVKLGLLLHPDMPVGDAMFHAHRFQDVLGGRLFFTSVAPGNYSFPYAPGLYVFAMPFADLVRRGAADMTLLRTIVIGADAVAAVLLGVALARGGASRCAAGAAVALYHFMPLDLRIATVGNLTNAFSQSLAVIAFALMASPPGRRRGVELVALAATLLAAFLSHTGTFAIGSVAAVVIAALLFWRGGSPLRPAAWLILIAAGVAAVGAVALYYAHFGETYRTEWARLSVETATAAPDAGGRGIWTRLASVPRYLYLYFGVPALLLSIAGLGPLRRLRSGPRLPLVVAGWAVACGLFLVIGIVTPVDMRHYLAVIPALASAGGLAVAAGWQTGGTPRAAVVGLVGWAAGIFLHTWWSTLS